MVNKMMKIKLLITLTVLCCLSFVVTAQAEDAPSTHPIDVKMEKCLKTQHGTMPRVKCYNTAAEAWDKDLTKVYAELRQAEDAKNKPALEAAQLAWEKYRDAEFDYFAQIYGQLRGTGYISVRITTRMEIVRARALQLESRLRSVKE